MHFLSMMWMLQEENYGLVWYLMGNVGELNEVGVYCLLRTLATRATEIIFAPILTACILPVSKHTPPRPSRLRASCDVRRI